MLLDRDLISILFYLDPIKTSKDLNHKSSYFKANAAILSDLNNINKLKEAWKHHKKNIDNSHKKLLLACLRLRTKYKEIRSEPKYFNKNNEVLKERLTTLKADLEVEIIEEHIEDWSCILASLKEVEALEAQRITSRIFDLYSTLHASFLHVKNC